MRVVTMDQRSDAWMAARAGRITASRAGDLMARTKSGPSTSRANLIATLAVERLTGMCVETFSNAAMQRGIELEPMARSAYEVISGCMVEEVGLALHDDLDYLGASVDGLVGSEGVFEAKCPAAMAKHLDALLSGSHAVEYRWQVMCQLLVTGRAWCDIASYDPRFPPGLDIAITRVERDESAIADLRVECAKAEIELQLIVNELRERLRHGRVQDDAQRAELSAIHDALPRGDA